MDGQTIRMLFDYHYALFDRIWAIADQLTAEQFVAENDYSLGSVRNHLVHCMNVDERWLARIQGVVEPDLLNEEDFPDQAAARVYWDSVRERVLAYIETIDNDAAAEEVVINMPHRFAAPGRFTRGNLFLHVVNHGTDHRAQILARLHELGAGTLEQDILLHWWD